VRWKDGRIGIYDTKSGFTAAVAETGQKSNALQRYIKERVAEFSLTGGIVKKRPDGWHLFDAGEYTEELTQWRRFEF
jgi:hypothetical protein